jgi:hypothetical protein
MIIRLVLSLSIALLLSACSGSSNDTPPPPTGGGGGVSLNIDSANALPAIRVAYGATAQSVDTGGLLDDAGVASSPDGGFAKLTPSNAAPGFVVRFMQKDPLGPFVENCPSGGTTTLNLDVNLITFAAGDLSIGDQIFVDYAECNNGLGEVANGSMVFTVANYTGDLESGSYRLEMDVLLIDFAVTTATDTVTSNGDSTVIIDTTGDPMILLSISGNSLSSVSAASTETVTSFLTTQTVDTSTFPEPYTLNSSGTVDSSQLAGVIEFETPVTFQGMGAAYPFAGELLVSGVNSAVKLVVLTDTTVRIETDSDGDGVFESAEETTWDDIAL